jgi:hypothetical protein
MGYSTRALADRYIATGEASGADIDRYIQNSADPEFWSVYYSTETVIARKPDVPLRDFSVLGG